jgi:hypothetical protein
MIDCDFCGAVTRVRDGKCIACGEKLYDDKRTPGIFPKAGLSSETTTRKTKPADVILGSNYKRGLWFGN